MTTKQSAYEAMQDAGTLVLRLLLGGFMLFHGIRYSLRREPGRWD